MQKKSYKFEPGDDLNIKIAQDVFGETVIETRFDSGGTIYHFKDSGLPIWHYSETELGMFLVIERMRKSYEAFSLYSPCDDSQEWFAVFERKWHGREFNGHYDKGTPGRTAPHAVCLAALEVIEKMNNYD